MQRLLKHILKTGIFIGLVGFLITSCNKNYFINSGRQTNNFQGNALDYLQTKPLHFDTLLEVIHLAGMDQVFQKDSITFFAPVDYSIIRTVGTLNNYLRLNGKDTVSHLDQISATTWKKMLSLYIFKGIYHQKDFPQIDTTALLDYPGQNYVSYEGRPMNIGVIYHSVRGAKYKGYRQLLLSYITNFSNPTVGNYRALIATSNINTLNGIINVLTFDNRRYFGFDTTQFILSAVDNGINIK